MDPVVDFAQPDRVNLLAYLLRSILTRGAANERGRRALGRLRGVLEIRASDMRVVLDCRGAGPTIISGAAERADARVGGDLDTLLQLALGRGFIGPWLRGRLVVKGKVWRLLPLLTLMKGTPPA